MYARIFQTIYDGTLVEDWRALVTFEQMLILCDADGIIDMTARAISRRTGIPIEHIEAGIRVLASSDTHSLCIASGAADVRISYDDGRIRASFIFHAHVMPISRGGSNDPENLATACAPCNRSKSNRTPQEWRGALQ